MHESPATAVLSLDKGNEIVGLSHGLERLLGWPADELLGAPVAKILAAPTTGRAALPNNGEPAAMTGLRPDGATLRLRVDTWYPSRCNSSQRISVMALSSSTSNSLIGSPATVCSRYP